MLLTDRVVLVVGASSGIGRAAAIAFAKGGARVLASARRSERLAALRESCPGIETATADVSDRGSMESLAAHTKARLGDVDILLYAAGTNVPDRAMSRLNPEIWDMMIRVNLNGAFYITNAVLPAMRNRGGGQLIYISSISGLVPDVSGPAYQAAKRGLLGLAHAIRVEEKDSGIRTAVICPGLVDTEILDRRPVKPSPEDLAKALKAEDVAETILFVACLPPHVTIPELQIMPACL